MLMKKQSVCIAVTLMVGLMTGCATHQKQTSMMAQLYDGRPLSSLNVTDAAKTEQEAIKRGDAAMREQNDDLALFEYIRSLSLKPGQERDQTLYKIGRIHQLHQREALAEKAYQMALQDNSDNTDVLQQLGMIYSKKGAFDIGKRYFLRAIDADQARLNHSTHLNQIHDNIEWVAALDIDEQSPIDAYMGLGIVYDMDSLHEMAQALYKKLLNIQPESSKLLLNIGYSYYMSGDYFEAKRATLAALSLDPDNRRAQNNLALIYLEQGKAHRALHVFRQQMKNYEALNHIGHFLMIQGEPDKAIPYLQQAIDENPSDYQAAQENLERALAEVNALANQ
ncbi:photosystem I assembly protein Ycf3 [Vibrio ruber DSM 16370]|uniref:Photosystem I assembly protein Ycf3 n=2 Tax=Vibrio ruber TaxID=184755 RepID=A0A1R4LJ49_VIBR1|nr:photosystem I assembly protein Ycf3 [Vibrio ruber DSM 16370]